MVQFIFFISRHSSFLFLFLIFITQKEENSKIFSFVKKGINIFLQYKTIKSIKKTIYLFKYHKINNFYSIDFIHNKNLCFFFYSIFP